MGAGSYLCVGDEADRVVDLLRADGVLAEIGSLSERPLLPSLSFDVVIVLGAPAVDWLDWLAPVLGEAHRISRVGAFLRVIASDRVLNGSSLQEECERLALQAGFDLHPSIDKVLPYESLNLAENTAWVALQKRALPDDVFSGMPWCRWRVLTRSFEVVSQYAPEGGAVTLVGAYLGRLAKVLAASRSGLTFQSYPIEATHRIHDPEKQSYSLEQIGAEVGASQLVVLSVTGHSASLVLQLIEVAVANIDFGARMVVLFDVRQSHDVSDVLRDFITKNNNLLIDALWGIGVVGSPSGSASPYVSRLTADQVNDLGRHDVITYVGIKNPCWAPLQQPFKSFSNPLLIDSMVARGRRVNDRHSLVRLAKQVLDNSASCSADFAAALCVLGYRALEDLRCDSDLPAINSMLSDIKIWIDTVANEPSLVRWKVSLTFLAGLITQQIGEFERAVGWFERCSQFDPHAVTPLIGTKVVGACVWLARLNMSVHNRQAAKHYLVRGIEIANSCLATDWRDVVGPFRAPNSFALTEMTQICQLAAACASGLSLLSAEEVDEGLFWRSLGSHIWNERERLDIAYREIAAWSAGLSQWSRSLKSDDSS